MLTWMESRSRWNISRERHRLPGRINGGCQTDAIHRTEKFIYEYLYGGCMCVGEFFSLVNLIEINISSQANVNGASGYGAQARFLS